MLFTVFFFYWFVCGDLDYMEQFPSQDAGGQGVGFLLGSLNVCWALTSENCYKGLPKTSNGEVITFKGI